MTRFLLSLDEAVDTVFAAVAEAQHGEIYVPCVPAARVEDIAIALIGDRPVGVKVTGIRPGEKVHEILVSEEEAAGRVEHRAGYYYAIRPTLPEVRAMSADGGGGEVRTTEYGSGDEDGLMVAPAVATFLRRHGMMVDQNPPTAHSEFV